jgi:hypothetical protein
MNPLFTFIFLLLAGGVSQTDLPPLNQKIIEYVDSVMGRQVDRGECWDLANRALEYSGSYFDRTSRRNINVYGRLLRPGEEVLPGDLMQFERVKLEWNTDRYTTYREEMQHHTAIVYEVNGPGDYRIAHQNTQYSGRRVGVSTFKMERVTRGQIMIYRPVEDRP